MRNKNNNSTIQCVNCGGRGHVYKRCNHPLMSFGIICYRIKDNVAEYLMVQRKDSLSYVEFMRGKYDIEDTQYLSMLVSNMTPYERTQLLEKDFDSLWKDLWQTDDCKGFFKEYLDAKTKYNALKYGIIKYGVEHKLYLYNLEYVIRNQESKLEEPEWGFPKGRRNINEDDMLCALREFKEETGIHYKCLNIQINLKPFEETFSGSNNIRYKHIYYIASMSSNISARFNPRNKTQTREIKDMNWFNYEDAQTHIRTDNVERKELFKRVHNIVIKNNIKV